MTRLHARQDSVPVTKCFFHSPNGRFQVRHDYSALKAVTRKSNNVVQHITISEVVMEIIRIRNLDHGYQIVLNLLANGLTLGGL